MKLVAAAAVILLLHQAASLCLRGDPGYDAADFNITVTANAKTGCFRQKFGNLAITVDVCNGTNGAICPAPTITTSGMPAGCGKVTATIGSETFCNGTAGGVGDAGATGPKGDQGAQGPLLAVMLSADANCKVYLNTAGSAVTICNGTSNTTGATGSVGLQGIPGTNGTDGAIGARGTTGANGYLPNIAVVDGSVFSLIGIGGLQLALNTIAAAGGGTVLVGGTCANPGPGNVCPAGPFPTAPVNLVSSCSAPLKIPAGVTLDLGGNTLSMAAGSTACAPLIQFGTDAQVAPANTISSLPLLANSTEGGNTVTIVANSILTSNLAVGQVCFLTGGYIQPVPTGLSPSIVQLVRISAFTNSTGVVTFRRPLVANFGPSGSLSPTLTCWTPLATNIVLRNGFLSFGGNTHTSSFMVNMLQGINLELSDIQILDPAPSTTSTGMIQVTSSHDSKISSVIVDSVETVTAVTIQTSSGITVSNVKVANSKSALSLAPGTHHCMIANLQASALSGTGISLVGASFNSFDNVMVNSATLRGVQLKSQSYRNVFHGLQVIGSAGTGVEFSGTSDSFNQFYGVVLAGNVAGPMSFGCGAVGNFFDGDIRGTPINCVGGATDPNMFQMVRQAVSPKGFIALSMHNATATFADFSHPRQLTMSLDSDLSIRFSLYGGDQVLRSATLSVS